MCPKNHSNGADDSDDEEEEEQVADNGDEDEKQVWSRVQATASYGVRRIPLFHKRSGQIMVSPINEFTQPCRIKGIKKTKSSPHTFLKK